MTELLRGDGRRRVVAIAVVLALLAITAVLAVLLRDPAEGPQQTAGPTGSPSESASPNPSVSPPASSSSPSAPQPVEEATETPEAGQNPVLPPVIVPPVPVLPPSEPAAGQEPALPAPPFPASLLGQDLTVIPGAGRVVALTFDAGANAAGLPKILSTLAAKGVAGTFFLTGNWVQAHPGEVGQIVSAGHRVANHSMTHPGFTGLTGTQITQQVSGAEQAILAAGADPRPLFRFPFGDRDARTIAAVNDLGYVAVRWTVDTLGWKGTSGGVNADIVADRTLAALQPGAIVLMHIGSNPDDATTLDADALPVIIDRIDAAGYGFVTLAALPAT